jgi:1,2-diacylglycerol 3-alpha-glucosyltransferase
MRVMIFADTYPPQVNGVASSVCTLARTLSQQGHVVMVCTAGGRRQGSAGDPFAVVRARAVPLPLYSEFTIAPPIGRTFSRMVQRFQPDIIHCHTPFTVGWQGARAALAAGIPLVGTHHTLFGDYVSSYLHLGHQVNKRLAMLARRYVATFYNHCDLVTSASQYLARDLIAGGLTRPMWIVPNALDTERFRPLPNAPRPEGPGRRIIYVGRLAAEKNLPHLMRLVAPVLRRHPEARFEIAGQGPMLGALVALARELDLERQIRFLGWLRGEELVERIAASDVSVSASLTENQPMALLESLACGVPVVALAAAGVPEIIEEGGNGFLVAPESAAATFAHRLEQVLDDTALRQRLAARAHESAQAYSHAACLRMTLASYAEATAVRCSLPAHAKTWRLWRDRRGLMGELRLTPRRLVRRLPRRVRLPRR